ncbi:hypothetical protein [Streptomyces hirsutus]|uniref:hypothetical protein n=1 Tax=Streptomyces hirsutus TaxID=35620 RepID=UPI00369AEF48
MFRRLREVLARRSRSARVSDRGLARAVQTPDPYVVRLPNPHDARWQRWHKRSRAAGRYLPLPLDEGYWETPKRLPPKATWYADNDVVHPYVTALECRGKGHVTAAPCDETVHAGPLGPLQVDTLAERLVLRFERHSCGDGTKGERFYDWALAEMSWLSPAGSPLRGWSHLLLVRRSISDPSEVAYFVVHARTGMSPRLAPPSRFCPSAPPTPPAWPHPTPAPQPQTTPTHNLP